MLFLQVITKHFCIFILNKCNTDHNSIRREKLAEKRKPVIERFVYVNAPRPSAENPASTVDETVVYRCIIEFRYCFM